MRKKIVAGNWKMNMNLKEGLSLAESVKRYYSEKGKPEAVVVLCTPFIHLSSLSSLLHDSFVTYGAQNCASEASGAYTGEVSAGMIRSTGAEYVIIGHSERRTYYNENDSIINKKTKLSINEGLKVIFCCGEVLAERENKIHFDVVRKQVTDGILNLTGDEIKMVTIAYEPVWAIGTGLTASPQQAQEMHLFIRNLVTEKYGQAAGNNMTILYGGSCKPSNAAEIFSQADVDGGLIGGASLKMEDFCAIVDALK